MKEISPLHDELYLEVRKLEKCESRILNIIHEVDEKKLYLQLDYPNLFKYSVGFLKLDPNQAMSFSTVSRKSCIIPELKKEIEIGDLTLSKARRIVPILSKENHEEWIGKAKTLTKAALEKEVSKISPHAFKKKVVVRSLSGESSSLRLELSDEDLKKMKRMQTLMMSKKRKTLDLREALTALVTDFLEKNDPLLKTEPKKQKRESAKKPTLKSTATAISSSKDLSNQPEKNPNPSGLGQKNSPSESKPINYRLSPFVSHGQVRVAKRYIPLPLKRQVIQRDRGQCQFKAPNGNICGDESFIQIHHLEQWSQGGKHSLENLQTLCSAHHSFKHRE